MIPSWIVRKVRDFVELCLYLGIAIEERDNLFTSRFPSIELVIPGCGFISIRLISHDTTSFLCAKATRVTSSRA